MKKSRVIIVCILCFIAFMGVFSSLSRKIGSIFSPKEEVPPEIEVEDLDLDVENIVF